MSENFHKVIIIGGGPAGYTAGIYTARALLKPLILEGFQPGGQLSLTTAVENFPGFPDGIQGPDLMIAMREQANRFGADIRQIEVTDVDLVSRPIRIRTTAGEFLTKALIIATGASARMIGLESEKKLLGKGVSSCATCDGAFFKNQRVVVVGGGDSAMEDALFLTRFATSVTVIHRRDRLRASKIMQEKAFKSDKIKFEWNSVVEDILDVHKETVTGIIIKNVKTGERKTLDCEGVFIAIGHEPNTAIFKGKIELDEKGYIVIKNRTETSVKGVFACGDVVDYRYRQAITAAGMGCMAAIDCEKYLEEMGE